MLFSSSRCGCHSSVNSCPLPGTAPCSSLVMSPSPIITQFSSSRYASPFVCLFSNGRKNGRKSIYAVASLINGFTNNVPSPGAVWLNPSQPCHMRNMEHGPTPSYRFVTASTLPLASQGSYFIQLPSKTLSYTPPLPKPSGSQRSTLPPSICGPSANAASPGRRIRRRSAYDNGRAMDICVEEDDVFQRDVMRCLCVLRREGCERALI